MQAWRENVLSPIAATTAGLMIVLNVPLLRGLFHFAGNAPHILGVGVLAACGVMLLSAVARRTTEQGNG